uniref:Vegetative storage protein n=1 Tax=Rhizophora mucronata TaxID=61149 RepID=A0A2P2KEK1_RHIMU
MGVAGRILAVLGLLLMAQQSLQLSTRHPLYSTIQRISENAGNSFIAVIGKSSTTERAFLRSGDFETLPSNPYVLLAGRKIYIGTVSGAGVLYVTDDGTTINAAIATQVVLDAFPVRLIINVGSAGTVDNSLSIADVVVPTQVAFTANFNWLKYGSKKKGQLKIGDYNIPEKGKNYLESLNFDPVKVYAPNSTKTAFWLPFDPELLALASETKVDLTKCLDESCLSYQPKLVYGTRDSTADIFYDNEAYRKYVNKKFKVSSVDRDAAAVLLVALSNGVPTVSIRGISHTAGGSEANAEFSYLGTENAVKFAIGLIEKLPSSSYLAMPNF